MKVGESKLMWMFALMLLSGAAVHLPAQASEVGSKQFEEIKAKAEKKDAQFQYSQSSGFGLRLNKVIQKANIDLVVSIGLVPVFPKI
jgi:hypothetical protein